MKYCAYKENDKFTECPPCSGSPVHAVRNYFIGPARLKMGADLFLCATHAKWWQEDHPLSVVSKLNSREAKALQE